MSENEERKSKFYSDIPWEENSFYWVPKGDGTEKEWGLQLIPMSDNPWDTRPFYTETGRTRPIQEEDDE